MLKNSKIPNFLYPVFILGFFGVSVQVYLSDWSSGDWRKIVILAIVAFLAGYFFSRQKANIAWNFSIITAIVSFLLLIVVLSLPEIRNIRSWIQIGSFTFQPSELAKVGLIVGNSVILGGRNGRGLGPLKGFFFCSVINLLVFYLLSLQPEVGTVIVMAGITWLQVLCSKVSKFFSVLLPILAIGTFFIGGLKLMPVYEKVLNSYQAKRIETFFLGEESSNDDRYQIEQAHFQIAKGGLWGSGFSEDVKEELHYLPERQNDLVIAVFSRAGGFFLVLIVIGLYLWSSLGALNFSQKIPSEAAKQLVIGFAGYMACHCLFNVGVALELIPTTGFPLIPLSQGGSGWISLGCLVGLLLSVLSGYGNLYNSKVIGGK